MSNSLLLFTIGPVKKFIEPSRKLRDVYAGSFLLSHLANVALDHLKKSYVHIIFPSENQVSAPNRIMAEVSSEINQVQLAKETVEVVQKQFLTICKDVFEKQNETFSPEAEKQLSGFLEINWVYEDFNEYSSSYKSLIHHMHNVKNTRMFKQSSETAKRKCDLYAEYNALITSNPALLPALKDGERLCAFAFVKRFLYTLSKSDQIKNYNNTVSSVAYMLLKSYLPTAALGDLEKLKDEGSEALFDLKNNQSIDEYSEATRTIANKLYDQYKHVIGSPYYVIVKLDGDGVGQKYQDTSCAKDAESLSSDINSFAVGAKALIEKQGGLCIFAGGEDILAFLPLHTLFETLEDLVTEFGMIKGLDFKGTLSSGIIVAHLMEPLKPLLQRVESLESHAKHIDDEKAALSMEVVRRSSFSTPLRMKFGSNAENLALFKENIAELQKQEHSTSFIQNVTEILEPIKDIDDVAMVEALLHKVLKSSVRNKAQVEIRLHAFMKLYVHLNATKDFIHFLQQLAFLARETKETCEHDVQTTST